jgi:hypothetical protein
MAFRSKRTMPDIPAWAGSTVARNADYLKAFTSASSLTFSEAS